MTDPKRTGDLVLAMGTDLRSSIRIAADAGLSDQQAVGLLRSLRSKDYVRHVDRAMSGAGYWQLTDEGVWLRALLEAAHG